MVDRIDGQDELLHADEDENDQVDWHGVGSDTWTYYVGMNPILPFGHDESGIITRMSISEIDLQAHRFSVPCA